MHPDVENSLGFPLIRAGRDRLTRTQKRPVGRRPRQIIARRQSRLEQEHASRHTLRDDRAIHLDPDLARRRQDVDPLVRISRVHVDLRLFLKPRVHGAELESHQSVQWAILEDEDALVVDAVGGEPAEEGGCTVVGMCEGLAVGFGEYVGLEGLPGQIVDRIPAMFPDQAGRVPAGGRVGNVGPVEEDSDALGAGLELVGPFEDEVGSELRKAGSRQSRSLMVAWALLR